MSRVYLPFAKWPEQDRAAWQKVTQDGDIFDGRGPAFHWALATRRTNAHHYGRWLGHLTAHDRLDVSALPADRVEPNVVRSYVEQLKASIAPRTVVSSLVGLKEMIKVMAPDRDWCWLSDICNRLNRTSEPVKDKRSRMLSSETIYGAAIKHLENLSKTALNKRVHMVGFRNTLMLALMTAAPLRLEPLWRTHLL